MQAVIVDLEQETSEMVAFAEIFRLCAEEEFVKTLEESVLLGNARWLKIARIAATAMGEPEAADHLAEVYAHILPKA